MTAVVSIALPEGVFRAHFTERGLAQLDWPADRPRPGSPSRASSTPSGSPARQLRRWVAQTRAALRQVLAGRRPRALPPLDLSLGTAFQRQVWLSLCRIAPGETRTYGQLAASVGRPGAARAVGNACGANPIPLLIPCHRVVPSGGGLGGFSGPLEWKKRLLEREGVWCV